MRFDKKLALATLFSSLTIVAIAGATVGTLSWYAYSKNVTMSYQGTSVSTSLLLRLGLVDDQHYLSDEDIESFRLVKETCDGHTIVWSDSATGFSQEALRTYLTNSPYGVDKLAPVSSHSRALSDTSSSFFLYRAPEKGETSTKVLADTKNYVKLPFAFKVLGNDNSKVADQDIWLTDVSLEAERNIDKAIRIFIENDDHKFIMNPSDHENRDGATKMGGLLDLDSDGTYDYNPRNKKELVYGEYTGALTHKTTEYGIPYASAPFVNVNGTPYTDERSTFYAKHYEHAYEANYNNLTYKTAEYHAFGKVKPSLDGDGNFVVGDSGIVLARTDSEDKVAYANFTIYLEGWDFAVIDKISGYQFSLGLEFNVNRI